MREKIHINRVVGTRLPGIGENTLILLTGARQTGKTTLLKASYPSLRYFNLDALEYREQLLKISSFSWGKEVGDAVLDEIQKEPDLFNKIKFAFDEGDLQFTALSGSAQVLLMKNVKETLSGRIMIFELFPLMLCELAYSEEEKIPQLLIDELISSDDPADVFRNRPEVLLGNEWDKLYRSEEYLIKWGGMPTLVNIKDEERKRLWLRDYSVTGFADY